MNIKCGICVTGLKLEITSLTNQLWRFNIQGLECACVCVCLHLFPVLHWQLSYTHTHTQKPSSPPTAPVPAASHSAYSLLGPNTPLGTCTLLSAHPSTPATLLHLLPPTSYLKRSPEIAQEAIRKNTTRKVGSWRGLQSRAI